MTEETVPVPNNVLVECPKVKMLIRAAKCVECEHYIGAIERIKDANIAFSKRFMVACRHPTGRMLFEVKED